jgi:hypothetical protein
MNDIDSDGETFNFPSTNSAALSSGVAIARIVHVSTWLPTVALSAMAPIPW